MNVVEKFIEKWCQADYPAQKTKPEDLFAAEQSLQTQIPKDLSQLFTGFGTISPTIELLDKIVETHSSLHDLNSVYDMETMVEQTIDWRQMGLPNDFIAIGSDCSGNMFCTPTISQGSPPSETAEIWFFDHDLATSEKLYDSVSDWFSSYDNIRTNWLTWLIVKFLPR